MSRRNWHRVAYSVAGLVATVVVLALGGALFREFAERDKTALAVIATAHVNHILGPLEFDALGGEIKPDLGVTAAPVIVLSVGGTLRAVTDVTGIGPHTTSIDVKGGQPESFALDPAGPMLTISNGYFGVLNPDGEIERGVPIPYKNTRLAPSVHVGAVYLFGGTDKNYRLYRFIADGTLEKVLESDEPIVAAADNENSIYAATASTIMRIKPGTPDILFKAPDAGFSGSIRSLVVTGDDAVMFSTNTKIYALMGPDALSFVNDAGGTLRLRDGVLYVLDPVREILFSLSPASAQLFREAAQ